MIRPSFSQTAVSDSPVTLIARPMGIDTYQEPVIYMRADCEVCRSEGFESQSRVRLTANNNSLVATINAVHGDLLAHGDAGLSTAAWSLLGVSTPTPITLTHAKPLDSFHHVRAKLFGHSLDPDQLESIVQDIAAHRYSDVHLSAFLAACIGDRMSPAEVVSLTHAMVAAGEKLTWPVPAVYDKHCVGGLPGNRTTPIVVAITTACGLVMPKTSSRAITSPAGTADTMETLTRVDLSIKEIRSVVEREGGCLAWGGAVALSPADDVLIRVERALDIDSEAQLVASVLSKKITAGSTQVLIDIPVGPTAKVRDQAAADRLSNLLQHTGAQLNLKVDVMVTDGTQPVGRGIGPALEARDVVAVLQNAPDAPQDLRMRACTLAGRILESSGKAPTGRGLALALEVLDQGRAWTKFAAICEAQGGLHTPQLAQYRHQVVADANGEVSAIDNRRLAKLAKLSGAPNAPSAGLEMDIHIGDSLQAGDSVFTIHAEARGELIYALDYLNQNVDMITIDSLGTQRPKHEVKI